VLHLVLTELLAGRDFQFWTSLIRDSEPTFVVYDLSHFLFGSYYGQWTSLTLVLLSNLIFVVEGKVWIDRRSETIGVVSIPRVEIVFPLDHLVFDVLLARIEGVLLQEIIFYKVKVLDEISIAVGH